MQKELEIVEDHSKFSQGSEFVDFSCQFSYHTVQSTNGAREEEYESENTQSRIFGGTPESLSSHPEQLGSSENEKMSAYHPAPNLNEANQHMKAVRIGRPNSLLENPSAKLSKGMLLDQPYVPKAITLKKENFDEKSDISGPIYEERYYKRKPSESLPDNGPESTHAKTKSKNPEPVRNLNFIQNQKLPKGSRSKNTSKRRPKNHTPNEYSIDSYPVRLDGSDKSEDFKSENFETPSEVEQIYKEIFKDVPSDAMGLTSISQRSRGSAIFKDIIKDWATTPLHEEYQKSGISLTNSYFDPTYTYSSKVKNSRSKNAQNNLKFYSQEESKQVYEFVRGRYSGKTSDQGIRSFYEKAMDTL